MGTVSGPGRGDQSPAKAPLADRVRPRITCVPTVSGLLTLQAAGVLPKASSAW